jgi:hypothetical protein
LTCSLGTTVGQDLEAENQGRLAKGPQTGINDMAVVEGKLVDKKKFSSRVRFLMQVWSLVISYGCLKQILQGCDQVVIEWLEEEEKNKTMCFGGVDLLKLFLIHSGMFTL